MLCKKKGSVYTTIHKHEGLSRWHSAKESAYQCKGHRVNPWVRELPWSRKWKPTSCLENSMDRGAWRAIVHGVTKSWSPLSNWTHTQVWFHIYEYVYRCVCLFSGKFVPKTLSGDLGVARYVLFIFSFFAYFFICITLKIKNITGMDCSTVP